MRGGVVEAGGVGGGVGVVELHEAVGVGGGQTEVEPGLQVGAGLDVEVLAMRFETMLRAAKAAAGTPLM